MLNENKVISINIAGLLVITIAYWKTKDLARLLWLSGHW